MKLITKPDDPFDYLLGLKKGGFQRTHGEEFDPSLLSKSGPHIGLASVEDREIDIARQIREVVESNIVIPKDMYIDDGDMPTAQNFYQWITEDRFGAIGEERPFMEQLIWATIAFNDACVVKGSYVHTDKGLQRIEDFVGNPTNKGMKPMSGKVVTDDGVREVSFGGMTGKRRKCLKVTYASGHSITVTPDHRVRVLNSDYTLGWARADALTIGDFGVMPHGTNLWPAKPAKLRGGFVQSGTSANTKTFVPLSHATEELARLVGYIISDGFMNKNTIGFINTDPFLVDDFVQCCEAVFGHTPNREYKARGSSSVAKEPFENVFLHGKNFVAWLRHIGYTGTKSHNKSIPDFILSSNRSIVINCLRAIFDCDGFVDPDRVGICLTSRECVNQVHMLMQNLGIYGSYREVVPSSKAKFADREYDRLPTFSWVTRHVASVEKYSEIIGSAHANKKYNLSSIRPAQKRASSKHNTAAPGVIPFGKETYAHSKTLRTEYHDKGLPYTKFGRRDFYLAAVVLNDPEFLDFFESRDPDFLMRLKNVANSSFSFSAVVKVEDAGYHEVYDLTVPGAENFICNGVIVHNCHVCSDKEWLYHTHKVDDTYAKFERKVALFEFGRCPHCGTTRADQINKGQMKYINELAVNAGQRCVVANTPVLTEHGVFRIVDTLPQNLTYGFTPFSINVHNGTEIESTVFAFKARPEPIYKVTFSNGCWIAGTKDHPILTKDGFVTLGDITVGTPVDFQYGMRQFGNVELPKYEAREYGINFSRGDVPPRLRLGNATVYEEFLRGLFLSNGRRAFPNMDVLNDVSAMLFNVGVPHRIEAPSIVLSPEQYDLLHGGVFERGFVTETVASVKIDGSAETFDYTLPSSHRFVTGGVISHNSGKSQTVGGFLSPYLTHRMLKLQKPAAYYGLTRNTVLHGTFVALTYVQAKDTLWTPFYGAISESKWFREYHALMRHYENKYGESLLKFNDTFVMYRHRGLTCLVGDTIVDTKRGLVQLKDVQVGDYVKGLRGEYHKVSAFYNNGKKETFRVTLASNHSIVGTADHLLLSKVCDTDEQVWVEIGALVPGDFIAVNAENHHSGIDNTDGIVWEPVKSVEKSCVETVYDITVDHHTHLFTANGIIVHNCYPAGPDRRILRGRTRYLASCFVGDTLIHTDRGLIPIKDANLVGLTARRGSYTRPITNWARMRHADDIVKVTLKNGMELKVTSDHKVLTIDQNLRLRRTEAAHLFGRYVGVTLGGDFPKELPLSFAHADDESKLTVSDRYVIKACELGTFFKNDLLAAGLPELKGINAVIAKLVNAGCVIKEKRVGARSPCKYVVVSDLTDCLNSIRGGGVQTKKKYDFSPVSKMTPEIGWLIGAMIADGSYKNDHEFTVTSADHAKMDTFCENVRRSFGVSLHPTLVDRYEEPYTDRPYWRVNIGTSYLKQAFRYLGLAAHSDAHTKEVPWSILQAPRDAVIAYLNAIFVTDGGLTTSGSLYTATVNPKLAQQTQLLLATCGYVSNIRRTATGVCRLTLTRESTGRFLQHDYSGLVKRAHQKAYDKTFTGYKHATEFRIPYTESVYSRDVGIHRRNNNFDPNIIWVEVVSVSKAEPEWVYDVTVDAKDHMLTANGIIAKNCDEIAYFDSNKDSAKVKVNAHEIYDALTNSLYTLRAAAERLVRHGYEDVFSGYSMNVTSPVAKNDMIHVLGKRAEESDSMYYVHRPTWEVNPDFPRNSKLITEAYRKDPESADKNFGANPPLIANPFLANHKMIRDLEDFDRKNAMRVRPVMKNSIKSGQGYMYGELDKIKRRKQASMCAIDAGSTDNSFSIAMGHRDGLNLVVDLVSEVIPLPGFRINHSLTYSELILPAMEARNVRVLLADRWNSIKLLDDAAIDRGDPESEEPTFIAKQYSLKYRDLVSVRTCIEQGIVRLPKSEIPVKTLLDVQDSDYRDFYAGKPVAHLFKQLFTIKDLEKSVGKGDGYTDDTWRAVALLVWGLLEEEFAGFLEAAPDEIVTVRPSAIAASKLYSGGGGSVGNGGGSLTTINGAPLAMIGRGKR